MYSTIDTIIRKSLQGELNPEDATYLKKWLDASEKNKETYEKLRQVWQEKTVSRKAINEKQALDRIWNEGVSVGSSPKRFEWHYAFKVAATLLIILIPTYFIGSFFLKDQSSDHTEISRTIIKENPQGQKSKLFLPDGSTVWLNAESSIKYEEDFDSVRLVELHGEGYFEVIKDPEKPFVVKAGNILTTVLGTSFNVSAYPDENIAEVTLIEGKVKVTSVDDSEGADIYYLEPHTGLAYNKELDFFSDFRISTLDIIAWKDGHLIFENDSFSKVARKLERWYGVQVEVVGSPPENWQLTGRFTNEYLADVLEAIKFSRDFEYELENKRLTILF